MIERYFQSYIAHVWIFRIFQFSSDYSISHWKCEYRYERSACTVGWAYAVATVFVIRILKFSLNVRPIKLNIVFSFPDFFTFSLRKTARRRIIDNVLFGQLSVRTLFQQRFDGFNKTQWNTIPHSDRTLIIL